MNVIGSIIKTGLELSSKFRGDQKSAVEYQQEQLKMLLEKARFTSLGLYHGFDELAKSEKLVQDFQSRIPIFDYDSLSRNWWQKQQIHPDITWPGKPDYFALSSGTTGKESKRIPITGDFIKSVREVGTSMVNSLPAFDFPQELFETEILMLSSSANLSKSQSGHYEGEISGINVSNFPGWYDIFYRPGKEIATIDDWDERLKLIVEAAPNWNIGAMAGIPSWILLMLKEIIHQHDLKTIHDIWPNLTVFASGGVAYETYRKDFDEVCERPLTILDTYLASEGFFAYTARPGTMNMQLALHHGYFFEFIPFDERGVDDSGELLQDPEVMTIGDVEKDQEYVLLVSSCAGAWRYMVGDVIKFTSIDPYEIKITGRTKFFLNTVGSQLSEEKMDEAILAVGKDLDVSVNEYSVSALQDEEGEYFHQWVIVSNEKIDESRFLEKLDHELSERNKNYAVARSKALKYIDVELISKSTYYDYLDQRKKKGGQVKTPKVMKSEKMKEYLNFIK